MAEDKQPNISLTFFGFYVYGMVLERCSDQVLFFFLK